VAIIAALRHEVGPAVRRWRIADRQHDSRRFRFYESPDSRAVLVCGGIGAQAARRACEAAIALFRPEVVVSAGFAGALRPGPKIGQGMSFSRVIDATDGSTMDAGGEEGVLLSFPEVVSAAQKAKLAQAYAADAVDMEAAAVARGAEARGVEFLAFKAISDGPEFEFPQFERFIRADGSFRTLAFVGAGAARPWLWPVIARMARNSARARETLCSWLEQYNRGRHETVSARCALRPSGVQAKR
jgi:adenosylhomocysteine nucleosidase